MSYIIDTAENIEINFNPETVEEEILQNLWLLYSSLENDVPLDRELGLNVTYVDRPIETAKALLQSDIYDKTERYEPRASVVNILFSDNAEEYMKGKLKPIVEVEIHGDYDNEKYTW